MKIANIDKEFLHIFWTIWRNSKKYLGKMSFKIILKATRSQGFTLSLEDTFFEKPLRRSIWPPSTTDILGLMNAFFKSQFNYCLLLWMCCNRSLNNKIDRLHELSLRIVYNNKKKDGSVSIQDENIRQLATEIFKVSKGLCPEIVKRLF